jgi:natural product precursor
MKELKLNQLSKTELENREMSAIKGGTCCGCGCHYDGEPGGSSVDQNMNTNHESGFTSIGGDVMCRCEDKWAATK